MDNFKKVFELVKKTGNTCFLTDVEGDEIFVLMKSDVYESLLDTKPTQTPVHVQTVAQTEIAKKQTPATKFSELDREGLLDKINNDVSAWKQENNK